MNRSRRSRVHAKRDLNLDDVPTADFMALLDAVAAAGPDLPTVPSDATATPVEQLEAILVNGSIGSLLAHARQQAEQTLDAVGKASGVTRARIQQIEQSENVEIATLIKIASALGYRVGIRLDPVNDAMHPLSVHFPPLARG